MWFQPNKPTNPSKTLERQTFNKILITRNENEKLITKKINLVFFYTIFFCLKRISSKVKSQKGQFS